MPLEMLVCLDFQGTFAQQFLRRISERSVDKLICCGPQRCAPIAAVKAGGASDHRRASRAERSRETAAAAAMALKSRP